MFTFSAFSLFSSSLCAREGLVAVKSLPMSRIKPPRSVETKTRCRGSTLAENDRYVDAADFIESRRRLRRTSGPTHPSRLPEAFNRALISHRLLFCSVVFLHFPPSPSPRSHTFLTSRNTITLQTIDGRQVSRSAPVLIPLHSNMQVCLARALLHPCREHRFFFSSLPRSPPFLTFLDKKVLDVPKGTRASSCRMSKAG